VLVLQELIAFEITTRTFNNCGHAGYEFTTTKGRKKILNQIHSYSIHHTSIISMGGIIMVFTSPFGIG
ncbi:MAG TPA: hypothetical protein VFD24_03295, partial [Chitinophagaceae bacterium]|nr:hypothetical protein [Chitinophagaceae bacterium]